MLGQLQMRPHLFTSRGQILALLGIAIGTGTFWRFPRIVATHGGGSFLIAWTICLLLWSFPLIVTELAIGRSFRAGPLGSFATMLGQRSAWLGAWVCWVVVAGGLVSAVVMGWTMRFAFAAALGELAEGSAEELWSAVGWSSNALAFLFLATLMAAAVVFFGSGGIERAARVLVPSLVVLIAILAIRAMTLPGANLGLETLLRPDWPSLANPWMWLEALNHSVWTAGAGWGVVMTYGVYTRTSQDTNLSALAVVLGSFLISLVAAGRVGCRPTDAPSWMQPSAAVRVFGMAECPSRPEDGSPAITGTASTFGGDIRVKAISFVTKLHTEL